MMAEIVFDAQIHNYGRGTEWLKVKGQPDVEIDVATVTLKISTDAPGNYDLIRYGLGKGRIVRVVVSPVQLSLDDQPEQSE